jgi:hypothetical protein
VEFQKNTSKLDQRQQLTTEASPGGNIKIWRSEAQLNAHSLELDIANFPSCSFSSIHIDQAKKALSVRTLRLPHSYSAFFGCKVYLYRSSKHMHDASGGCFHVLTCSWESSTESMSSDQQRGSKSVYYLHAHIFLANDISFYCLIILTCLLIWHAALYFSSDTLFFTSCYPSDQWVR